MFKYLLCFAVLCGMASGATAGPLQNLREERPRVDKVVDVATPEVFVLSVTLTTGEVVKTEKIALTPWSLKKRFSVNSADKVVRVMPQGSDKMRVIPVDQIDKVEVVRQKDEPKPAPEVVPTPVPTPTP